VIDGEAVILGVDGVSDFDALHAGRNGDEVQLYAFDVLAMDGDDLRDLPLSMRKTNLARLLRGRPDGMFIAPFEQGEIGPDLFRQACKFGLEGLVSKRLDRRYRGGRSPDQGQEPGITGHAPGQGGVRMTTCTPCDDCHWVTRTGLRPDVAALLLSHRNDKGRCWRR